MMEKWFIRAENAEFQIIESLKNNREKRAGRREIFVEGTESIKQALKAGLELTRIIVAGAQEKNLSSWAQGIIRQYGPRNLAAPFGGKDEPRLIEMAAGLYRKLSDRNAVSEMIVTAKMPCPRELRLPKKPFILVLDRPSDTGNLGSLIRSANSFGVDAVLIMGHGVDPWDPKTIRASLGSVFFTVPFQLESLKSLLEIKEKFPAPAAVEIWGTDSGAPLSLASQELRRPLVLVLGNEAKGMSLALRELCDKIISIPLAGNVNSLNLASAASIFMWEVARNSAALS